MPWWAAALVSVAAALLATWLALVVVLLRTGRGPGQSRQSGRSGLSDAARLLPDVLRLVTRLARDRALPFGVRIRLWLLLGYLASPIDLVPDFVPVIGYADDILVAGLVLRSVARRAGIETLQRHWPGTPDGFTAVCRLARLEAEANRQ
jgi:uncharacterized membrane protein YkvA (DUF1232 family)